MYRSLARGWTHFSGLALAHLLGHLWSRPRLMTGSIVPYRPHTIFFIIIVFPVFHVRRVPCNTGTSLQQWWLPHIHAGVCHKHHNIFMCSVQGLWHTTEWSYLLCVVLFSCCICHHTINFDRIYKCSTQLCFLSVNLCICIRSICKNCFFLIVLTSCIGRIVLTLFK